jgi:peptidoglycan/LPS O-acetylase OafA/YrhL
MATYAVIAFFIVSGFMIFLSVSSHRDETGKFDVQSFFRARLLRIYPPLLAAVLISMMVYWVITGLDLHGAQSYRLGDELFLSRERVAFEWERLIPTLLLLYNVFPNTTPPLSIDGPLWTLSFEWWFYMFAMACAGTRSRRPALFGWVPLVALLALFGRQPSGTLFWVLFLIWHGGFLLGYLYAHGRLESPRTIPICGALIAVFIGAIAAIGGDRTIEHVIEPLQRLGNRAHHVMMFMAFILTAALAIAIRCRIRGRFLVSTAEFSYTLYLVHYPLLLLAFSLLHPVVYPLGWEISALAAGASLAVIVPIAARLARVVENRSMIARLFNAKMMVRASS